MRCTHPLSIDIEQYLLYSLHTLTKEEEMYERPGIDEDLTEEELLTAIAYDMYIESLIEQHKEFTRGFN